MPRYFFHIRDGVRILDEHNFEFLDDYAAQCEAIVATAEMVKDIGGRMLLINNWQMVVKNEQGEIICELQFTAKAKTN